MIDYHGAFKPDGLRRTYPNLVTREGVMGKEYLKWSARTTPVHNTTLPFTRMLAGPLDYTPGAFGNATRDEFIARNKEPMSPNTRAHELALYVVLESPLKMVSDYPEHYAGQHDFEFIKQVPATWDEVRVIDWAADGEHHRGATQRQGLVRRARLPTGMRATVKVPLTSWAKASTWLRSMPMHPMRARTRRTPTFTKQAVDRARCST